MNKLEKLLSAYEADVQFPDVSGMEHLDMLLTRSRLADAESKLSTQQAIRLATADQQLLQLTRDIAKAIADIADLRRWREHEHAPPNHWWWYLDVLAETPIPPDSLEESLRV